MTEESDAIDKAEEENEGSGLVTEAKVHLGHLNTTVKASIWLVRCWKRTSERNRESRQLHRTQIETLQETDIKGETGRGGPGKKAEEERRAARRIKYTDEDYQVLLRIVQAEAGICDPKERYWLQM